jgi:hypothetical protein
MLYTPAFKVSAHEAVALHIGGIREGPENNIKNVNDLNIVLEVVQLNCLWVQAG